MLREATEVPKAMALSRRTAEKGNLGVISDAGVAVMAAYAGLKIAVLNVAINAAGLKDREFAEAKLAELQAVMQNADCEAEEIYQIVKAKL